MVYVMEYRHIFKNNFFCNTLVYCIYTVCVCVCIYNTHTHTHKFKA